MDSTATILRNRYRVVKRLGTGGGGSVYAVDDLRGTDGSQRVALKALFLGDRGKRLLIELLQQEFRVLATLRHPLLARVYDFGRLPENSGLEGAASRPAYFYTRDLIDGEDLLAYCQDRSVLEICTVCHHTAEALDVLHRAGMVHRDFKPANVIVAKDGRPHLIDFGLAQGEGSSTTQTAGTAQYFSPEMIRGDRIDRRADLYAFGISLFQLLVGELPLPRASFPQLVQWHLDGAPLQVSARREVPPTLDRVLQRLTNRDPDQRYPSAAELALALAEVVSELSSVPPPSEREPFVAPAPGETIAEPLVQLERLAADRTLHKRPGPPVTSVIAEPGGGKTTFLRELAWRCQVSGIEVIRAQFQAGDPRPYGVLVDVLSQAAGAVGLPPPVLQSDAADPDTRDRYGLYEQIREQLSTAAQRGPLLILLDAVEQADEESRAALRFLAHTLEPATPLLLVAAHAPDPQLDSVLGDPPRVELRALPVAEVTRMLTDASARSDPDLAERIHQHTGGNALFTVEVLRKLSEAGWPASPDLKALVPPHNLEEVYARRWAELPAEEREVLVALAVFARPASGMLLLRLLEQASGQDESTAHSERALVGLPLERLETLAWIVRTPTGAWAFRQAPAAHFVLGAASAERRKRLHLAAAHLGHDAALSMATHPEQAGRGDGVDVIEHARHALAAGEIALARETLEPALAALRGLGSHRRAIDLLQQALALVDDETERRRLRLQLGELHRVAGDFKGAEQQLEAACEGAEGAELASARIALAQVYRAAGDTDRALGTLAEVLTGRLPLSQRLAAHAARVATLAALDDHEAVLQAVDEALRIERDAAQQDGADAATRAELRGRMAWALGHLERYKEATEAFAAALQDAQTAGDQRAEANILNRWAAVAARWLDYERVADRYNQALDRARAVGDVERVAAVRFNLAVFHLRRGQYAACLTHLEQSLRLFDAMGAEQNAATARCNLGYLELKLGMYEQARVTLREAVKRMHRLGRRSGEALAILLAALVAARRGQLDDARTGIAEARRISQELGLRRDAADALLDLAEVELLQDRPAAATEALRHAAAEVDLDQFADLKARAITLEARAAAQDEGAAAREPLAAALREALAKAKQLDSPELLWQCHGAAMELAVAAGQPSKATSHAVAGTAILGSMADGLPTDVHAAFWQDPWRRALRTRAHASRTFAGGEDASMLGATMLAGDTAAAHTTVPPGPTPSHAPTSTGPRLEERAASASGAPISSHPSYTSARDLISTVQERFYRLLEIYRRINAELDPERLLGLVMDTAVELTGAERGFLLLGPEPAKLKVEIARNLDPNNTSHSYSRSIAEQVATTGEPVITVSAHNDPRFDEFASVHQLLLESVLCIPIHAQDKLTGVLYMESRFQSGRFTPDDQRLLMAFGDQVAIALTNARLVADNLRKARELERACAEIEALAEQRGRMLSQRTAELEDAQRDLAETRRLLETQTGKHGMVGRSGALLKVYELIDRVAPTDVPVLIEGESGTGKEMVARAIHNASPRKKARLVSVNCAAIPENLLESELFGHVRGAFTGADRDRKGLFSAAHGGTLFLDEIGDMPARMQVDLLRALQEKMIRPVGGAKDIQVDVRVIAASNRSLAEAVKQGTFREDLFYRLHVIRLGLPALRERVDDIPLLVEHFLGAIAARMKCDKPGITKKALRRLMGYEWPGNVRQLEHTLMNAMVLAEGHVLDEDDFSLESPLAAPAPAPEPAPRPEETDRQQREREEILAALAKANWNKSRAAAELGIPRRTFYRRLRAYGIQ